MREIAVGAHADAVARCCSYVGGLARPEEKVLCGWPVLSINEWGSQQVRLLASVRSRSSAHVARVDGHLVVIAD